MAIAQTTPFGTTLGLTLSTELERLAERVRNGIVEVRDGRGGGAGTIVRQDGLIVTNHHVVPGEHATVTTASGARHDARVVASLLERDLAVLRIDATGLPALPLGDSAALRVGELLMAVGHPLGVTGAASLGVFSGVGPIEGRGGRHFREGLLAAIELRPGNSGGPLVNMRGEVIGINSMVLGPHTALAVPIGVARGLLGLHGARPTLGAQVGVARLPAALAERHRLATRDALLLLGVRAGTPAEHAGLLPGDIILTLNGTRLQEPGDLAWRLIEAGGQPTVTLGLLRGGEPRDAVVELDSRP